jgi:hypothetical protein
VNGAAQPARFGGGESRLAVARFMCQLGGDGTEH